MHDNPIKLVTFSEYDYFKPENRPRGGERKVYKKVDHNFISKIHRSIIDIEESLNNFNDDSFIGCASAVVELEESAISKSNRPTHLFNEKTCPFFGDLGFSKFLIQITPNGLKNLKEKILNSNNTKIGISSISTIKSITFYKPTFTPSINKQDSFSVRLFRYNNDELNEQIDTKFESILTKEKIIWKKHPSSIISLYKIETNNNYISNYLSKFSCVQSVLSCQSISISPMFTSISDHEITSTLPIPDEEINYPIVGVVDTGVSKNIDNFENWVVERLTYVSNESYVPEHGTFVSGLISNGKYLNGNDNRFPSSQSKILSIEVIGDGCGDIYDIIEAMYDAARKHPYVKVWNLSLGANEPVTLTSISDMALMLDEFQDEFNCLCIVAAGNFDSQLKRSWPPINDFDDRICSPGDTVRGLTIGSIAHVDGFVKNGEPSHFSRRGPVSNYIQKPELVHFGGNVGCDNSNLGVISVSSSGVTKRDIGTSFSAPLVSSISAQLFKELGRNSSPTLIKALLIHSANINNSFSDNERPYYGWGVPQDVSDILSVKDYESTFVLQGKAQKSFEVQKLPFPIPQSLRTKDGKVRAEFFITLVYHPELDPRKAFEYCQVDLSVGLGEIYDNNFTSKIPLKKSKHENESAMVRSGDKWSPIKVYQKSFPRGVDVTNWKLRVTLLDRDGYEPEINAIPFSLVITIRDIDKEKPIYNEMATLMDQYNWEVDDLAITHKLKI